MRLRLPVLALFGFLISSSALAAHFDIVFARFSDKDDPRVTFPLAILDLALKKMNATYTAKPSELKMERLRAVAELGRADRPINLIYTSMSADVEEGLRPIRIPLYRGLIGHRLFIIHKDRQADFDKVKTLDDLKKLSSGQGLGWVDIKILENAGIPVLTAPYDQLFKLLDRGQFDSFPRGALEAFAEVKAHQETEPNLTVEKNLMVVYRSDLIFYTHKADEELAATIEQGLLKAYADGSFMKLFNGHPYIKQAKAEGRLDKRRRFEIANPFLSPEDKAIPDKFWEGR